MKSAHRLCAITDSATDAHPTRPVGQADRTGQTPSPTTASAKNSAPADGRSDSVYSICANPIVKRFFSEAQVPKSADRTVPFAAPGEKNPRPQPGQGRNRSQRWLSATPDGAGGIGRSNTHHVAMLDRGQS